jgi:TPR repeat protein
MPFRFDSSRRLKHHSNFRPIFAVLGRGLAGQSVTLAPSPPNKSAIDGQRERKKGRPTMARFDIAGIECATLGEAPTNADSFFALGMMYSVGRNVPVDFVTAHKWFNLAAMRGNADAARLRREVAEQMSDTEISQAQRAARAWIKAS